MLKKKSTLIIALLLPVQIILIQLLKYSPAFIEKWYSLGLYPWIGKMSRSLWGWIPFSAGDVFYTLIAIVAIRWIYKNFKKCRREPVRLFAEILAHVSVVYFMFHVLWGFNYYREPLHKSLQLGNDYTTEELIDITNRIIKKSNALHNSLGFADSIKIDLPYSQKEMLSLTENSYTNLQKTFPNLSLQPRSVKKSLWSLGLTYMGYSGYLNPFSGEAQVNGLIKSYKFPVVACHEQAHQLGYAKENEANFIATLAAIHNDNKYIKYTGYIFALRYCVNELSYRDKDLYFETLETIHPGILASYKEMRDFWDSYDNPFEVLSKAFYNLFLKANNQPKGIKTYSYMVALMVNYFDDKDL
jgi:hypothetical protein